MSDETSPEQAPTPAQPSEAAQPPADEPSVASEQPIGAQPYALEVDEHGQVSQRQPQPIEPDPEPTRTDAAPHTEEGRYAQPVRVDGRNRRNDNDALEGHMVDVVSGEHQGRRGAFMSVVEHYKTTGYPKLVLVRTRDEFNELLTVAYEHIRNVHGSR